MFVEDRQSSDGSRSFHGFVIFPFEGGRLLSIDGEIESERLTLSSSGDRIPLEDVLGCGIEAFLRVCRLNRDGYG